MSALRARLSDPTRYRRLLYLLSAFPLGQAWFVALVTVWSLCLGFLITPVVIPLLIGLAAMTRGFAAIEASLARALLDVEVHAPPPATGPRFWQRFRRNLGGGFWKAQAFLWLRWGAGLTVSILAFSALAVALGAIFAPIWVPFVHGGAELGFWRPHTFVQSLALVPAGLVLLPLTILAANPVAEPLRLLALTLLPSGPAVAAAGSHRGRIATIEPVRGLRIHATADAIITSVLVIIWAATSRGSFWPIWIILPLAVPLAIHAWVVVTAERADLVQRFRGSRDLARTCGIAAIIGLYFIAIWWITGHGYFWPGWIMLALGVVVASHAAAVMLAAPDQVALTERIETLESSRAGAVDVQDSELRRIERDLHDGAQARLVALGMSLGMAEQKLTDDPAAAGALVAEARAGAEEALRELRDLARGIHPPVLADRGLEAALRALISATPTHVELAVSVGARPAPAVETCAYFVVAEALANAAKHARASRVDIRIVRSGDVLVLEVSDNGVGGADAAGSGLVGLRRRVEALDGTLTIASPAGGPTTIRAELPCES